MTYEAKGEQQDVVESTAPVLVVLGGAGTGKTTTAVAAARRHLEDADERLALRRRAAHQAGRRTRLPAPERVLFLSFSRTAVAQIIDRSSDVIGPLAPRLEVATFHGFAWRIINSFGPHHGYPLPLAVLSEAQRLVGGAGPGLTYSQLVPTAMGLLGLDKVRSHYSSRYGLVICDEFQDTDDQEWQFLQQIAPTARRILLGDTNQCIYAGFKHINADTRIAAAVRLPGADKITLPPLSYRDPSGTLPAAAEAAMRRDFTHDAIRTAAAAGRISVTDYDDGHGHAEVIDLARRARGDGHTVSIFTHTNVATSSLSDALLADGLVHEQVGLSEAYGEALTAQLALVKYALKIPDSGVLRALAVYVQATERKGNRMVPLAQQMLNPTTNPALRNALKRLARDLRASVGEGGQPDVARLAEVVTNAYNTVGAARGQETWLQAARQARIALRRFDEDCFDAVAVEQELLRARDEALVGAGTARRAPIQVMNLHQTKGREADTTILLLGSNEFHGSEGEPYPTGSKLLYVVMTRARHNAHLVVPNLVHGLWEPLVAALR
ncbi:AAA family ATPase [Streptomyces antibioticus]|uniref:UvrD-helicase domain-containing protein n=1 Tax=Streptomyces antibioticus TaxID=1890 RepID=UPI0022597756|nr:UvrD-helicase domain-containing protein [Streptomyces antibioticus]MCX5173828.1 AAA family ATPase [Streptomyces antibioticus]